MHPSKTKEWRFAIWGALAITLLSLCPQLLLWGARGTKWNGSYAEVHGDEWVYSAYVQALIDGRPRRNDPFTGRDDQPGHPQPESLFSIQFVPSYLIAVPARLLGISSSTAFIVLGILAPFIACLAIFWLIANLIEDQKLAAAGSVVVLCFGALAAGQGMIHVLSSGFQYAFLPFLRRYEPLVPFPLVFVFCTFVWKSLTNRRFALVWAIAAGLVFDLLIFSYFFLWTFAMAWLAGLACLWFIGHSANRLRDLGSFTTIVLLAVLGFIPYFLLLSRRSTSMDTGQKLTLSHAPDLLRTPELFGFVVIALIFIAAFRGRVNWRAPAILFASSLAIAPLVVFNQQVITGRSLQPFHYESFIANYVALVGGVVAGFMVWRGSGVGERRMPYRFAARLVIIAIWWAAIEVVTPARVIMRDSQFTDRAAAVCQRLRQLSRSEGTIKNSSSQTDPRPLVLASENKVAVILPTFAPQAVFWAPHFDFLDLAPGESHARFYQWLYYTGFDRDNFAKELSLPMSTFAAVAFGHERVIPDLSVKAKPVTSEEIAAQVAEYQAYCSSFSRAQAVEHILSYVIVPVTGGPDLSNLDRWYQRDKGEQVGDYILYRVQLRP